MKKENQKTLEALQKQYAASIEAETGRDFAWFVCDKLWSPLGTKKAIWELLKENRTLLEEVKACGGQDLRLYKRHGL